MLRLKTALALLVDGVRAWRLAPYQSEMIRASFGNRLWKQLFPFRIDHIQKHTIILVLGPSKGAQQQQKLLPRCDIFPTPFNAILPLFENGRNGVAHLGEGKAHIMSYPQVRLD